MSFRFTFIAVLLVTLTGISGCGGSGGSPDPVVQQSPPPVDTTMNWDDDEWAEKDWQ